MVVIVIVIGVIDEADAVESVAVRAITRKLYEVPTVKSVISAVVWPVISNVLAVGQELAAAVLYCTT